MKFILILFSSIIIVEKIQSQNILIGNPYSSDGYKEFSIGLTAVNSVFSAFNTINLKNESKKGNAGFGLITGVAQLGVGIINLKRSGEKGYTALNISSGAITTVVSLARLTRKTKK